MDDFVPGLHNILKQSSIDRKLKIPAIHTLGSLSLNIGDTFNTKYLQDTITIINLAAQMSTSNLEQYQNDPDSQEFCKELRDQILEEYTTILVGVGDSNSAQIKQFFKSHLETICSFMQITLQVDGYNNVTQLQNICELIKDMATQYQDDRALMAQLQLPHIESLLNALVLFPGNEGLARDTFEMVRPA